MQVLFVALMRKVMSYTLMFLNCYGTNIYCNRYYPLVPTAENIKNE